MQPRSNSHSSFFSSLKQVEKRLKLDNPPAETSSIPSMESLSSPLYINCEQPSTNTTSSDFQDSEPPKQFLSSSFNFPQTNENQLANGTNSFEVESVNEIDLLVQLLDLSDCDKHQKDDQNGVVLGFTNSCDDSRFYSKVVGIKGPKCKKEVERMDGWIKHFMSESEDGERNREPLRLAHLLLGKYAFVSQGSDRFDGLEFPSTIEEFLQNDPPEDKSSEKQVDQSA